MSVDDGAHALLELEIAGEQIHCRIEEWLNNLWLQIDDVVDDVDDGNEAFRIL